MGQVGEGLQALSRGREIKQGVKRKIQVGPFASLLSINIEEIANYFDCLFLG